MMAHSLGNMVVSSMIQGHGLQVSRCLMCNNVLTGVTDSFSHHAWHKQELFKGRGGLIDGLGGTTWSGWNVEEDLLGRAKISVEEARQMADADFRTNTVFYCYPASMNAKNITPLVRIRSRYDESGKLAEAYYGKIYGDFDFDYNEDLGLTKVRFLYYLNLTSLDKNLEWGRKNNLCANPERMVPKKP